MTKARLRLTSLLCSAGAGRRVRLLGVKGVVRPKPALKTGPGVILSVLATTLAALVFTAAPALAAGLEEPQSEPVTGVLGTSAMLHGEVNPGGEEIAGYEFSYSTGETCTGEGAVMTPVVAEAELGAATKVSAALTGLEGGTRYTFCLLALREGEVVQATSLRFTTLPSVAVIESSGSSGVGLSEATFEGVVNPENQPSTSCVFEYGETTGYGESVVCEQGVLEGASPVGVSAHIAGLKAGTSYDYRLVVGNATGEAASVGEFTTAIPQAPVVETSGASVLTQSTAGVSGGVNPLFQPLTACEVRYATSEAALAGSPPFSVCAQTLEEIGAGGSVVGVSAEVTGLTPNTYYYYRFLAANATGPGEGATARFLTLPNPPTVMTGEASALTPTSASISGSVDPGAQGPETEQQAQDATSYYFQYGTSTSYGRQTPTGQAGEGETPLTETAALAGLEPGVTYHYRVVAINNTTATPQTSYGEDRTFEATAIPPILSGLSVQGVSQTGATISATLESQGLPTRYELQLAATPGRLQPITSGQTSSTTPLTLSVGSLTPGTTYYYKLVASNPNGTIEPEGSFTTAPTPAGTAPASLPALIPYTTIAQYEAKEPKEVETTSTTKPLTKKQKLAKALKTCRKDKKKSKRQKCEKQARKKL
jgi:phosphodiesterase/alkaline phosphatase D-like protein